MDEILRHCRNLCGDDFRARAQAYQALRNSREFTAIAYRVQEMNLTTYELARLLGSGSSDALASSVLRLLEDQCSQSPAAA